MGRLFWKFFLATWVTLIVSGVLVAVGVHVYHARGDQGVLEQGPKARFQVEMFASVLRHAGWEALRSMLRERHDESRVYVVDGSGHEILGRALPPGQLDLIEALAKREPLPEGMAETMLGDERILLFSMPTALPPSPGMGPPPHPPVFEPILFTFLASVVLSALLAWYLSTPVKYLRGALSAVAEGDLSTRVGALIRRSDEIGDLGRDFDRMAQRIETLMAAQQRLLHDVSHELRSPLARMQIATGLIRKDPATIDAGLARIDLESSRLDGLIGEILTLSRLEAGMRTDAQALDLYDLTQEVVDDARFEADGCAIRFSGQHASGYGHPDVIARAIDNVVRNALRHAPGGSALEVEVARRGAEVVIEVRDLGPGLAPEELTAIFAPFYQGRTGSKNGGFGLGLAIAKRSMELHGGRIEARNRPGGGLCVALSLPAQAVEDAPH